MNLSSFLQSTLLLSGVQAATTAINDGRCMSIYYSDSTPAVNEVLKGNVDVALSGFDNFVQYISQNNGQQVVNGTHRLHGQYCPPLTTHPKHKSPLLLFVHGITYNSTYFSGLGDAKLGSKTQPLQYSWHDFAARRGFHTLSIDRLGSGLSDHPDPAIEVQVPLQLVQLVSTINFLRSQGHDYIVLVGHSFGSSLISYVVNEYPTIADALILSGVAQMLQTENPLPNFVNSGLKTANAFDPMRFPSDPFKPAYFVTANKTARELAFWSKPGVDFSTALFDLDFAGMIPTTLGEFSTGGQYNGTNYKGPVFVMTGQYDGFFCGAASSAGGDCNRAGGPNQVDEFVKINYPNANKTGTFLQPESGHCMLLHYRWRDGLDAAHAFLDGL